MRIRKIKRGKRKIIAESRLIKYDKLVRDKIPEIIEKTGKRCVIAVMDNEKYIKYLDAKLNEKLAEYQADKSIEELADLSMPFNRFEDMGYMHHSKCLGILQIDQTITKNFDENDLSNLLSFCEAALNKYWGDEI